VVDGHGAVVAVYVGGEILGFYPAAGFDVVIGASEEGGEVFDQWGKVACEDEVVIIAGLWDDV
jgi:hypothetical protein